MTTYNISTWSDLVLNAPYFTGDILEINDSFLTDSSTVIDLKDITVNGNNHTITFSGRTKGLFKTHGATISYLTIDGNNNLLSQNEAFFLAYNASERDQWAMICNCSIINGRMSNYCGGFLARYSTQNGTETTNFDNCSVTNLTLGSRFCGVLCGNK